MSVIFFYTFLFIVLITEGWGLFDGRSSALHAVLFAPFILFSIHAIQRHTISAPVYLSIFFLLFIVKVTLSTFFAVNREVAFEHQFLYLSIVLILLYTYNNKKQIKRAFPLFLIITTVSTLFYSAFLRFFLPDKWLDYPIPLGGYQVVLDPAHMGHNPIGAFILVPFVYIMAFTLYKPRVLTIISSLALLAIVIASHLRTAYLSIIGVIAYIAVAARSTLNQPLKRLVLVSTGIIVALFVFITTAYEHIPALENIRTALFIDQEEDIYLKSTLTARSWSIQQAIRGISENPITGTGSFTFYYTSMQYTQFLNALTGTSHNMFLDIAVENGVVASIVFIVVVSLLFKNGIRDSLIASIREKGIFAIFLALLILFQLSHYHKMYYLFTLFLVCGVLLYKEHRNFKINACLLVIIGIFIALVNSAIIFARVTTYNGNPDTALQVYPFLSQAHRSSILNSYHDGDYKEVEYKINRYALLFPQNPYALEFIANTYKLISEDKKALAYYAAALSVFPHENMYLKKAYEILKTRYGKEYANQRVSEYIHTHNLIQVDYYSGESASLRQWCTRNEIPCENPEDQEA